MRRLERFWYSLNPLSLSLSPLAVVFGLVIAVRRKLYRTGLLRTHVVDVPVVVIGNISVGGTGKTPLVIWLAEFLRQAGWRPGIVSRGYGGSAPHWPQPVYPDSDPATVGDEAVLLAVSTACPIYVGPDRPAAVDALLRHSDVDIVLSDDGLQHYALARDVEIVVIDGERRFGNGLLLPAGPLREPPSRLDRADLTIVNGQGGHGECAMVLAEPELCHLRNGRARSFDDFAGVAVHAVAGIGNPDRFFAMLRTLGLRVTEHPFPDHHAYSAADLALSPDLPVMMTEKDAVKCRKYPCDRCWVVRVRARPDAEFVHRLTRLLKELTDGKKAA